MNYRHKNKPDNKEYKIFVAYELGLLLKAAQALLEIIAGVLFYITSTNNITNFILTVAHGELAEIPHDFLSDLLISTAGQISSSSKFFIIFYLLTHGVVKLIIIIGLFLKKRWAFPAALIGLGGLIIYQIYSLIVRHSLLLFIFTLMDIIILWLIWHEDRLRYKRSRLAS